MFTAHDAAHTSITHNFTIDTLIGMFIADFCCGLSIGWWKSSHNVHHLVTNQPVSRHVPTYRTVYGTPSDQFQEHDPDIQNVPLFSTAPAYFKSISSSYYDGFVFPWDAAADFIVPYQVSQHLPH
jgi:sphingolipid 8-(E)-desaturase